MIQSFPPVSYVTERSENFKYFEASVTLFMSLLLRCLSAQAKWTSVILGKLPPRATGNHFHTWLLHIKQKIFLFYSSLSWAPSLPSSWWVTEVIPHYYNATSSQPWMNDGITYADWEEFPTTKSPQSPQTLPDDCVLLAESLPASELLRRADYLLPCQPVAHCFLVSLHLLFVLSLGVSVLPSAVCHEERLPSQAAWRSLPAGGKALCSAIVAPFLEPDHLDLYHSNETLVHKLFVLQWECTWHKE